MIQMRGLFKKVKKTMINKTIKPILFNTEDVKAILDGKKNKTARVFSKTQL